MNGARPRTSTAGKIPTVDICSKGLKGVRTGLDMLMELCLKPFQLVLLSSSSMNLVPPFEFDLHSDFPLFRSF